MSIEKTFPDFRISDVIQISINSYQIKANESTGKSVEDTVHRAYSQVVY